MADFDDSDSSDFSDASLQDESRTPKAAANLLGRRVQESEAARKLRQDEALLEEEASQITAQAEAARTEAATTPAITTQAVPATAAQPLRAAASDQGSVKSSSQRSTASTRVAKAIEEARLRREAKKATSTSAVGGQAPSETDDTSQPGRLSAAALDSHTKSLEAAAEADMTLDRTFSMDPPMSTEQSSPRQTKLNEQRSVLELQHQLTMANHRNVELEEKLDALEARRQSSSADSEEVARLHARIASLTGELELARTSPSNISTEDDLKALKDKLKAEKKARKQEVEAAMKEISVMSQQVVDAEGKIAELELELQQVQSTGDDEDTSVSTAELLAKIEGLQVQNTDLGNQASRAAALEVQVAQLQHQLSERNMEIAHLKDELNVYQEEKDEQQATDGPAPVNTNQLIEQHDEELRQVAAELQQALEDSKRESAAQLAEAQRAHENRVRQLGADHARQLSDLKQSHQEMLQELEARLDSADRREGSVSEDAAAQVNAVQQQLAREKQQAQALEASFKEQLATMEQSVTTARRAEEAARQEAQAAQMQLRQADVKQNSEVAQLKRELMQARQDQLQETDRAASLQRQLSASQALVTERMSTRSLAPIAADRVDEKVDELQTALEASQHDLRVTKRQLEALQDELRSKTPQYTRALSSERLDGNNADLLQAEIENLEEQLAGLRGRYENLSKRIVAEEFARIELEEDVSSLKKINNALESHNEQLRGELGSRDERLDSLQTQTRNQQQHIMELNDLLQKGDASFSMSRESVLMRDELDSLRLANIELEGLLEQKSSLLLQANANLEAINREVRSIEATMASLQEERATMNKQMTELSSSKSATETELTSLRAEMASERMRAEEKQVRAQHELQIVRDELAAAERKSSSLQAQLDQLKAKINQADTKLHSAEQTAQSKELELDHMKEKLRLTEQAMQGNRQASAELTLATERSHELEMQVTRLQAENAALDEKQQRWELDNVKLRSQLDASQQERNRLVQEADAAYQSSRAIETRLDVAKEENERVQRDFLALDAKLTNVDKERSELQRQLEEARIELDKANALRRDEQTQATARLQHVQEQLESTRAQLEKELSTKTELVETTKAKFTDTSTALEKAQQEHQHTKLELQHALDVNQQLEKRISELKQDLEREHKTVRQHERHIADLNEQHGTAALQTRALDQAKEQLRSDLADVRAERDRLLLAVQGAQQDAALAKDRLEEEQQAHERTQNQLQAVSAAAASRQDVLTQAETQLQLQIERLRDHEGRNMAATDALQHVERQRDDAEQLLSEVQSQLSTIKAKSERLEQENRNLTEKATEMRRLWEAEVGNRNAVGAKILELEDDKASWSKQIQRERARVAKALAKKSEADDRVRRCLKKIEGLQHRIGRLESDNRALDDKLAMYSTGQMRSQAHEAEIAKLRAQLTEAATKQNDHEQGRVAQLMKAQQLYESEQARNASLNQQIDQLEAQMHQLRTQLDGEYLHHTEVQRLVDATKRQQEGQLSTKLTEINQALENDAAIRDAIDKHRRLNFEETVESLRRQLAEARIRADF
eukprot:TRINITY_DN10164_c0_g1_i2.p1 TRINITY_DN10164_c0_g1~~TRINITY_DN10164_c0_g1_i2.p1  ORF type:complete len:1563 (+),score=536.42 TRINITY_DN10164_c0_g1_i2:42-4691(+)